MASEIIGVFGKYLLSASTALSPGDSTAADKPDVETIGNVEAVQQVQQQNGYGVGTANAQASSPFAGALGPADSTGIASKIKDTSSTKPKTKWQDGMTLNEQQKNEFINDPGTWTPQKEKNENSQPSNDASATQNFQFLRPGAQVLIDRILGDGKSAVKKSLKVHTDGTLEFKLFGTNMIIGGFWENNGVENGKTTRGYNGFAVLHFNTNIHKFIGVEWSGSGTDSLKHMTSLLTALQNEDFALASRFGFDQDMHLTLQVHSDVKTDKGWVFSGGFLLNSNSFMRTGRDAPPNVYFVGAEHVFKTPILGNVNALASGKIENFVGKGNNLTVMFGVEKRLKETGVMSQFSIEVDGVYKSFKDWRDMAFWNQKRQNMIGAQMKLKFTPQKILQK